MFNRGTMSYHDKQTLTESDINKYIDKHSAYYLKSCFNPEIPMRCREEAVPKLSMNGYGIDGSERIMEYNEHSCKT